MSAKAKELYEKVKKDPELACIIYEIMVKYEEEHKLTGGDNDDK